MFINDILECVQSKMRFFADDCILYRYIKNKRDSDILQDDLNNLAAWEKKWIAFHPEKCSAIRVTRSKMPRVTCYTLKCHLLGLEDSTRYLGVELQSAMSWNREIDHAVKKANSMLRFLRCNLRVSNEDTESAAYFSMVRPVL